MKKKGTKELNSGLAPMHSVSEPSVLHTPAAQSDAIALPVQKKEKKKPLALGYRIFSALLLLCAVGGLFLGLVFDAVPALSSFSAFRALLGNGALSASLIGCFIELFQNFSFFTGNVSGCFYIALLFFFAVCLLMSVCCSLTAFFSGIHAKISMHVNAAALFLGYATLFIYQFVNVSVLYNTDLMFDLPSAILAAIALISLIVLVFLDKQMLGMKTGEKCLNLILFLLTLGVIFAFFYPGTATSVYMATIGTELFTQNDTVCGIAVLLVAVLFAFNYFAATVRLQLKRGYAFDTVRYGLQLCAVIFFFVAANDRNVFAQKTVIIICMSVVAFLLFAIPFLVSILLGLHKKDVKDEHLAPEASTVVLGEETAVAGELQNSVPDDQPDNTETIFDSEQPEPKINDIDEFVTETIQSEKEEPIMFEPTEEEFNDTLNDALEDGMLEENEVPEKAQESPIPEPEITYTKVEPEEDKDEIIVFTADNFDPNNPMLFASTSEPSGVIGAGTSFFAGMPPVRERIVEKIVEVEKKQPKVELTEFEKLMAEQAKETAKSEPAHDQLPFVGPNQPIINQTFITNPAQQTPVPAAPVPTPAPAPAPAPAAPVTPPAPDLERLERERRERERERYDSQYAYDPFISTLTPEERNEFGDVFISYRHGIQNYLPTYVIGGDNRKFFRLLFAQLGRYREYISQNLMDKMYAFVSASKSNK